jgi:hypothetical protein
MKRLTLLVIICAATATPSVLAQDPMAAIRAACAADVQKFCAGVAPGGGRIVACLKAHKDAVSDGCKQAAGLPVSPSNNSAPSADSSGASSSSASSSSASHSAASPSVPAAAAPAKAAPALNSLSGKSAPAKGTEKFAERVVPDTEHQGMRAATIHLPEKWRFESKIEWHYGWVEYPASFSSHAENPDNAEAYFQYPHIRFVFTEVPPQLRQYDKEPKLAPGHRGPTGAFGGPPQPPMQALAKFIQQTRPNVPNFKWIGQQDLPDLAKVLKLDPSPNQHGVAIKISYDLNGQPVEEAFYGVYYVSQGSNAGVNAGMIKQTNWGLQALQSFRAPAGTLDKRMPMFCVIAKSMYVNPEWARLSKAITAKMLDDFNQKLKQGYDQLRAAQAIVDQTMKQQAAFQANFDKQEAAFRSSGGVDDSYLRDGGARSAADHWDDVIRGVDTVNDPSTGGTTQLSNLGQYHFTDGFGNYRTSDNPNYTPESAGEVGSWTQMTETP